MGEKGAELLCIKMTIFLKFEHQKACVVCITPKNSPKRPETYENILTTTLGIKVARPTHQNLYNQKSLIYHKLKGV